MLIAGPFIDSYLNEIGRMFYDRLRRGHLTGMVHPPFSLFMPSHIFNYFSSMIVGYGGEIHNMKKSAKVFLCIDTLKTAKKLFNTTRFDGSYYLTKVMDKKQLNMETKKTEHVFDGTAKIVVSLYTPMRLIYNYKTEKLSISIFIQRYDANNIPVDKALQTLMNQEGEEQEKSEEEEQEKSEEEVTIDKSECI